MLVTLKVGPPTLDVQVLSDSLEVVSKLEIVRQRVWSSWLSVSGAHLGSGTPWFHFNIWKLRNVMGEKEFKQQQASSAFPLGGPSGTILLSTFAAFL